MTLGFFAGLAAVTALFSSLVFLVLTWYQDHEERTRAQRRLVTVEESPAVSRSRWSVAGLGFTIVAILVVVVLSMLGT
jgi:ABC-type Fe3+ transport system permease subunit